ncbi:DKNYY domain-containing protein [Candidatus Altiarchaeota archaeon]
MGYRVRNESVIPECMGFVHESYKDYYRGYTVCDGKAFYKWREGSQHGSIQYTKNITGADPASLRDLGGGYAADKDRVYWQGQVIRDADPASFYRLLYQKNGSSRSPQTSYSMDKDRIYYERQALKGIRPQNFKYYGQHYCGGSNTVYHKTLKISGADPATFKVVDWDGIYSKDKDNVYIKYQKTQVEGQEEPPKKLEHVDPSSFEALNRYYTRDYRFVYYHGKMINGADPETIEVNEGEHTIARDADSCYMRGKYRRRVSCPKFKQDFQGKDNSRANPDQGNLTVCNALPSTQERDQCILKYVSRYWNTRLCDEITDRETMIECKKSRKATFLQKINQLIEEIMS